jgi:hypothetical protein
LIAADDDAEVARGRLQAMTPQERSDLVDSLRRFDLQLSPQQQRAIRSLDEQVSKLPPKEKTGYLAALRRYHNWLDSLPENIKDSVLRKPPPERMALIRSLWASYPLARESTPAWMQFADVTNGTPFETASIIKIWQELSPAERHELETAKSASDRREKLFAHGHRLKIAREIRPPDFQIDKLLPKVESKIDEYRVEDPGLKTAIAKAKARLEAQKDNKPETNKAPRVPPQLRRLAINLYFMEQAPPQPVSPQRLAAFHAALPPWTRGTFVSYPADEARRRLTVVYRLVYPKGEMQTGHSVASKPAAGSAKKSALAPPPPVPVPGKTDAASKAPPSPPVSTH